MLRKSSDPHDQLTQLARHAQLHCPPDDTGGGVTSSTSERGFPLPHGDVVQEDGSILIPSRQEQRILDAMPKPGDDNPCEPLGPGMPCPLTTEADLVELRSYLRRRNDGHVARFRRIFARGGA